MKPPFYKEALKVKTRYWKKKRKSAHEIYELLRSDDTKKDLNQLANMLQALDYIERRNQAKDKN